LPKLFFRLILIFHSAHSLHLVSVKLFLFFKNQTQMRKLTILSVSLIPFFFLSCTKESVQGEFCEGIFCLNGGKCLDGACDCPPEWEGSDCSEEKIPASISLQSIRLLSFPKTRENGESWDPSDGPDVYIIFYKEEERLFTTGFVQDLSEPYEFSAELEFSSPNDTYRILVYDFDENPAPDDYLGGIRFTPYREGEGFPTSYVLDCPECTVSFELKGISYSHL
jgi:hypothetical protein